MIDGAVWLREMSGRIAADGKQTVREAWLLGRTQAVASFAQRSVVGRGALAPLPAPYRLIQEKVSFLYHLRAACSERMATRR